MPPFSWFEAIFFGFCQLAIAASLIFWSHYWRRRKLSETRELGWFYRGKPLAEAFASHLGHLLYFALAWLFASLGFALIAGGIAAYYTQRLGSMDPQAAIAASVVAGLVFTVIGMSIKTVRPPSPTS